MYTIPKIIRYVAISSFFITASAQAQQCGQTAPLINERLSYMKDVAKYKADNHLAIEDLAQEEKVINNAIAEAESLGLNGLSIKPFMVAQINAAKAIQYRYRADWLSQPEPNWQSKPLDEVRTQISALSSQILTNIASELKNCHTDTIIDKNAFIKNIQQKNLQPTDVEAIFSAFTQIKMK